MSESHSRTSVNTHVCLIPTGTGCKVLTWSDISDAKSNDVTDEVHSMVGRLARGLQRDLDAYIDDHSSGDGHSRRATERLTGHQMRRFVLKNEQKQAENFVTRLREGKVLDESENLTWEWDVQVADSSAAVEEDLIKRGLLEAGEPDPEFVKLFSAC